MQITVILCTYNRERSLAKTLEGIVVQELPQGKEWELLVVDSSTDGTRQVVEEFSRKNPGRIRYIFEGKPGKSNALNTGIREARGEILVFVDDDVTIEPAWLANLTASLSSGDWAGAGGRIRLDWDRPRPRWLQASGQNHLEGALAGFDLGDQPGELDMAPFGANMAYRKETFEEYGSFRTDMGPARSISNATSEDTEFGRRLLAAGKRLRYEPEAVVHHPVPESRLQKQYFLTWRFAYGRAIIREFGVPTAHRHWFGIPRYLFRELAKKTFLWLTNFDPYHRFFYRCKVWQAAAEIAEIRRHAQLNASEKPPRHMDRYSSLVREEWRSRAR
jgi:glycosyltransferase involved in cell wall biosynthesis